MLSSFLTEDFFTIHSECQRICTHFVSEMIFKAHVRHNSMISLCYDETGNEVSVMKITIALSVLMMAALFLMLFAGVALIQDKKYFSSAPKDIVAVIQPREERFPGAHALGWFLLCVSVFMILLALILAGVDGHRNAFTFQQYFMRYLIMFLLLKLFDILFFDFFLLTHSHFYQHFYPETEGCAGFHSFGFNWKSHVMQIIACFPVSALLAWICLLFS